MSGRPENIVERTLLDRMDELLKRWIEGGSGHRRSGAEREGEERRALAVLAREALRSVASGDLGAFERWLAGWHPNGISSTRALEHVQHLARQVRRDMAAQLDDNRRSDMRGTFDERMDAVIRHLVADGLRRAAVQDTERHVPDLAGVVRDPLYSMAADRTFRYVSPAIEELTGHPPADFLDDPDLWSRLVVAEDRPIHEAHLETLARSGAPTQATYRVRPDRGDTLRYVMDRARPVLRDGRLVRVDGVLVDITERVELELRLERTETLRSLGQLARDVAHDFNNLLVSILGHADLLMERLPEGTTEARKVRLITSAAEQGARLTDRLLGFARGSTHAPRRELIPPSDAVSGSVELARASIPAGLRLETSLHPDTPPVQAARGRLDEAVLNLILNAAHACAEGRGSRIIVEARPATPDEASRIAAPRAAVIEIRDDGPGMTESVRARVFEPLFTTRADDGGSGLGCAIAYGVAVDHGGVVTVDSALGEGASFRILLPAATSGSRRAAGGTPPSWDAGAEASSDGPPAEGSDNGDTILVVDDEPSVRQLLKDLLEGAGYAIVTASSGREAIDIVLATPERYALVILDVMMHPVDGTETFGRLRDALPDLPIIFCTGHSDAQRIAEPNALSAAPVVRKPFRAAHLLRAVRDALEAVEP
ncbi:MAG: hybrid sensor histidine kinase/response regulator [Myxococcota bacterium]